MSIVSYGWSQPDALVGTMGWGLGAAVVVVCPVEQVTAAVEILEQSGIAEHELQITALDPQESVVVIEYNIDSVVLTPIQRSAVVDRFMSIQAVQPELDVSVSEVEQTVELVQILQAAAIDAPAQTIQVVQITEEVDVKEAIDKVQS